MCVFHNCLPLTEEICSLLFNESSSQEGFSINQIQSFTESVLKTPSSRSSWGSFPPGCQCATRGGTLHWERWSADSWVTSGLQFYQKHLLTYSQLINRASYLMNQNYVRTHFSPFRLCSLARLTKHKGVNLTDIGPNYADGFIQITSEQRSTLENMWQFR